MSRRILAITVALFALSAAAQADVWRWTDPKGQVQYSDRWVPGSVLIKTDSAHAGELAGMSDDQQKLAASNASIADQQAQQQTADTVKADVAKVKEQQCKDANAAYEKAVTSRRLYKEGKDGERTYVSDQEMENYRVQLLNARKLACSK